MARNVSIHMPSILKSAIAFSWVSAFCFQVPTLGQTVDLETILGPAWAGQKPSPTQIAQPINAPPTITPDQYATSLVLSLGASLVPAAFATSLLTVKGSEMWGLGLITASLILGPSTGQYVYGFSGHGILATTVRLFAVGAGLGILGASMGCGKAMFSDQEENCTEFDPTFGLATMGTVFIGGFLYSLIQPAFAIRHEPARTVLPIEVLPRLSYDAQGRSTFGLVTGWRF
jgi:hypothetical protein